MRETADQMRADLAFLRAVTEDGEALPELLGWHLVAIGGVFAAAMLHIWSVYAGVTPWPESWKHFLSVPGVLLYMPIHFWVARQRRGLTWGPAATAFGAAWAAMATMIPAAVVVLLVAQQQTGMPFYLAWPALAFVLYGGAWMLAAIVTRKPWHAAVALGCFAVAATCAALIRQNSQWLFMAGGLAPFVAAPGLAIVRRARSIRR
jgi:hypothetical protein